MNFLKVWWRGTPVKLHRPDGGVVMGHHWHWTARLAHKAVRFTIRLLSSKVFKTALAVASTAGALAKFWAWLFP